MFDTGNTTPNKNEYEGEQVTPEGQKVTPEELCGCGLPKEQCDAQAEDGFAEFMNGIGAFMSQMESEQREFEAQEEIARIEEIEDGRRVMVGSLVATVNQLTTLAERLADMVDESFEA